jgi:prevent-host-death family protein
MKPSNRYHPISYLKSNTADVARELAQDAGSIIITQNGMPSFVCVSMEEYYQTQETNALLKLISLGKREIAQGKVRPLAEARKELEKRILAGKSRKAD